jgi:Tol biopolymer transport system component
VTKPDGSRLETSHRWPVFMPDGRHFLYLAANFAGHFEKNEIFLGALDSTEKRPIVSASANFAYSDPGYLLYWRDNALVAQKFDVRSYALSGEARTISDEVQYLPQIDLALFDVAGRGTLVVQAGKGAAKSQLKWFDRSGKQLSVVGPPGSFANPTLSPDGRRVAFDQPDPGGRNEDVWIRELSTDSLMRFTFGPGLNQVPIWRADGNRVLFASNQGLEFALVQKNADGSGPQQHLANLGGLQQGFWDCSRDGKYLLLWKYGELWYMPLPDGEPKPLLQAQWFVRNAQFSPDGRWLAYSTNETGDWEVYVAPFPSVNGKWQVSRGGGGEPRWRRDGKELFYLSSEGRMMAVTVKTDGNFEAASPVTLFQTHLGQPISSYDLVSYDVTGDGQRFLINTKVDEPNAAPLSITLNWASEMEK